MIISVVFKGLSVIDVTIMYKNESYLMTYMSSIFPMIGPDSWPSPDVNSPSPPMYAKKSRRPKKSRQKEPNEVQSSTQAKKSKKSLQNESPSKSREERMMTQTCRKCGELGHNRRSYRWIPPPAPN